MKTLNYYLDLYEEMNLIKNHFNIDIKLSKYNNIVSEDILTVSLARLLYGDLGVIRVQNPSIVANNFNIPRYQFILQLE